MDETSGILTTLLALDADVGPTEYTFTIIAEDSSIMVLSSSVPVTITVVPQIEVPPVLPLFDVQLIIHPFYQYLS